MSESEDTLERLESKIDRLSKQLRDTRKAIIDVNTVVLDTIANYMKEIGKLSTEIAVISEASRAVREELERRSVRRMFYNGLIMGLILGILGNLFVSYWVEYVKGFGIPLWVWGLNAVVACLVVWYLIWQFEKESRRRPERGKTKDYG